MAVEAALPTIGAVIFTAVIDSINPCAIGVLILLITTLMASKKNKSKMLMIGLIYIAAVYITYLAAGIGLTYAFTTIPLWLAEYISIAVGTIIVFLGIVEIKDFFWYGQGFSLAISPDMAKKIHKYTQEISVPGAIFLGAFVAAVELPCTGGPYLAIILILSQNFNFTALLLLMFYNLIFVMPLIVILTMVYFGAKITVVKKWKHGARTYMRLATGLVMVFLGWLLILIANGTIAIG